MNHTEPRTNEIRDKIAALAKELGVDCIGFASVTEPHQDRDRLFEWLARGYQASLAWMERDADRRSDVEKVLPNAQTVISIAVNYKTDDSTCEDCGALKVSRYAWGKDYHHVLDEKLKALTALLSELEPNVESVAYVDTGPILEKAWAERAGVGWIGKNANLTTRTFGSWVFLGEIITTLALSPDPPHQDFCGSCTRCLDACPTDAFPEPYVLDSSKCIAYWTIEHRGDFPENIGNDFDGWIFGCDICQDVCPWNRFSRPTREMAFVARADMVCPPEERWLNLTEAEFREEFAESAVRRTKNHGLARNIQSQRDDPLESVLKAIEWKPIEDFEDFALDELER
jgi:epoxyqueuosine reductase